MSRRPDTLAETLPLVARAGSLDGAASALAAMSALIGADGYVLFDTPPTRSSRDCRIVASSWPHVLIEILGGAGLAEIAAATEPAAVGTGRAALQRRAVAALEIPAELAAVLGRFGIAELASVRLNAGSATGAAIFAAPRAETLDLRQLTEVQLLCCYLWSRLRGSAEAAPAAHALSERERECLYWVSEGKTTDEVAMILEVSANTVNRYILHATQKLSASNRSMAIALAIRGGII